MPKRIVDTNFWEDDRVADIFSPEDRYFYLFLLTNPYSTQIGIYHILVSRMAMMLGYSREAIMVLIDRFETKYNVIRFNRETSEIAIRNYLRYSIVKGGSPVLDQMKREAAEVRDKTLFEFIVPGAERSDNATVKELVIYLRDKYINPPNNANNNAYANANANDDSYHDSYHESVDESSNESYHESSRKKTALDLLLEEKRRESAGNK